MGGFRVSVPRGRPAKRSRCPGFVAGGPKGGGTGPGKVGGGIAAARGARPAGGIGPRGAHARAPAPTAPRAGPGVTVPARPEPAAARYATHPLRSAESFSKIVLASAGEFPYSTFSHGGVAQLGERLTGSQEVRGSIPLVSTRALNEAPTQVGAFFHIGTQGQRRHHDPPGRQDRALNGRRVHGSIFRRGSR